MGVALTEILIRKNIELSSLRGKTITVDSPMWLYQFLSSIRQRDGQLLMDSKGSVTSHLAGLYTRLTNVLKHDIKPVFVFDGEPPKLKKMEMQRRRELKEDALKKFEEAKEKEDETMMRKYASRTSRLTPELMKEAKELIRAFGIPVIDAPSEAEAQASHMVNKGDAYAVSTNDADALLFGATNVVRNLNLVGKKKQPNKFNYVNVEPDMINLSENLNHLGIDQEQLIMLAMLVGTDYNQGGIKGIGPKNALKLVKQYKSDMKGLFEHTKWNDFFDYGWEEVFYTIKNMKMSDEYSLSWDHPDKEKIMKILVDEHEFSAERVENQLKMIMNSKEDKKQKGLGDFF